MPQAGADPIITEFATGLNSGADPQGIAPGTDGKAWFVDAGTNQVGEIGTDGSITYLAVQLSSLPQDITNGPDGNMWITESGSKPAIAKVTSGGGLTEYTSGLPSGTAPETITSGPDGNVWFVDNGYPTKALAKITPAGTITEFPINRSVVDGNIIDIATGSDGNLWFTAQGLQTSSVIGRVTPAGSITYFSAGLLAGSAPGSITSGPDGNLWFTDQANVSGIGRITPTGTITEFTSGLVAGSLPYDIVQGADGNLWFTDDANPNEIGQITTSGSIQEFPAGGPHSVLGDITAGSDGNLWFTDEGTCCTGGSRSGVAVGRVIPTGPNARALAAQFMPILDFDSSEKWRPLNVDNFLTEQNPTTGQPWNQICTASNACSGLTGAQSLSTFPVSSDYVKIHNSGSPDSFRSPNSACVTYVGTTQIYDCNTSPASTIYYHVIVEPAPKNQPFIDYWFFYRYNQGINNIGNHAGDWEGVTVAPAPNGQTFQYAEFSEHGKWKTFLRDNLYCDNGGVGSCGSEVASNYFGQHVMTFPAAGSHSNYPGPNTGPSTDGSTNGSAPWGRNLDTTALLPFPSTAPQNTSWTTGPENWTDWPGNWGDTQPSGINCAIGNGVIGGLLGIGNPCDGSPCSPAATCSPDHADHYFAPWSGATCAPGAACPSRVAPAVPLWCSDWFSSPVAALGCAQQTMRHALNTRVLGRHGGFTIYLVTQHRRAATAPGLAQVLGHPLGPGERAKISGDVPPGTQILVQAQEGPRALIAVFTHVRGFRGAATIVVQRGGSGFPRVTLQRAGRNTTPSRVFRYVIRRRNARR